MKARIVLGALLAIGCGLLPVGCSGCSKTPVNEFTLAWSEYPSWSVFGVAADKKLMEQIEKKWNVRIKLELLDYDPCIQAYASNKCDAVCITNMDVLNPALNRKSVAILPTSTSFGADACIVVDIKDIKDLKNYTTYGLRESVSQYAFYRNIEKAKEKPADYKFEQLDPKDAAKAMQAYQKDTRSIMVWNPFVLQTLKIRKDARRLFDSTEIPEEIIDMVVVGQDVLDKPGGTDFACAIIDTYYEFNKMLADSAQRDDLLIALGEKFSSLNLAEMKEAVDQTRFYKTPEDGLTLFTATGKLSQRKLPDTMNMVTEFYVREKILKEAPKLGYGSAADAPDAQLRFDPTYIKMVKDKK